MVSALLCRFSSRCQGSQHAPQELLLWGCLKLPAEGLVHFLLLLRQPVEYTHNKATLTSLPFYPNMSGLSSFIRHPKTEFDISSVASHTRQVHHCVFFVFPFLRGCSHSWQHSRELFYHVSVNAMGSKPCDCTQLSSSSCLFPILHTLVYRHFIGAIDRLNIPVEVQRELSFGYICGCFRSTRGIP